MKDWIKKYWWVFPFILLLPFVINFILLIPAFSPIVGENTDWLSFWGGYLGAIISAGVAFAILHIQRKDNEEDNKNNRENKAPIRRRKHPQPAHARVLPSESRDTAALQCKQQWQQKAPATQSRSR